MALPITIVPSAPLDSNSLTAVHPIESGAPTREHQPPVCISTPIGPTIGANAPTEAERTAQAHGATVGKSRFGLLGSLAESASDLAQTVLGTTHRIVLGGERLGVAITNEIIDEVLSPRLEKSLGLPVRDLLDFDRFLYRALSPSTPEHPHFRAAMESDPPFYVRLPGHPDVNVATVELIRSKIDDFANQRRSERPPAELDEQYHPVWHRLIACVIEQRPLIDVVLDEHPHTQTPAELMAYQTVAACFEDVAVLGAIFDDDMYARMHLRPWLERNKTDAAQCVDTIAEKLVPDWLDPFKMSNPFGYDVSHEDAGEAAEALLGLLESSGDDNANDRAFIDAVNVLDKMSLSGSQTLWIKLLRDLDRDGRSAVLSTLGEVASQAISAPAFIQTTTFADGSGAADLSSRIRLSPHEGVARYDRVGSLITLIERSLIGLGLEDRAFLSDKIFTSIAKNASAVLLERDAKMRKIANSRPGDGTWPDLEALFECEDLVAARAHLKFEPESTHRDTCLGAAIQRMDEFSVQVDATDAIYGPLCRHRDLLSMIDRILEIPTNLGVPLQSCERGPVMLGEFADAGKMSMIGTLTPPMPPAARPTPELGVSIVIEGGGGKGLAYADYLKQLEVSLAQIENIDVRVDEFIGTSAGAITAGLLASGYSANELESLTDDLNFTNFFSDFHRLMGGLDSSVRGVDRNGVFSTRVMYQTLDRLIRAKCPVEGRPVLFDDLPNNLKVVATVVSTDLPENVRKELDIQDDGTIVFSKETTPMMDVAAAMCSSAAVPLFFQAPQITVSVASDEGWPEEYRLQLVDGGIVNNLPASTTSRTADETRDDLMVMLPVYAQTPKRSQEHARLTTLDFDGGTALEAVDSYNRARFVDDVAGGLPELLEAAHDNGYGRATLALNLSTPSRGGQKRPVLQGRTRARTKELHALASQTPLRVANPREGRRQFEATQQTSGLADRWGQHLYEKLYDKKDGVYVPGGRKRARQFVISEDEARSRRDIITASVAAMLVTKKRFDAKTFECD